MSSLKPTCLPRLNPHGGFINIKLHDHSARGHYYVVTHGLEIGIYTHHSGRQRCFSTYAEAKAHWAEYCCQEHHFWCPDWTQQNHEDNAEYWGVKGLTNLCSSRDEALWLGKVYNKPTDSSSLICSRNIEAIHNFVRGG
ncbi:hypothetical protein C8J57DRAFT_1260244 [Mycena rebaudengoi]|nr:hypothetical protein C8J57DRAFT_1260244 [Mycena rebaudengoi]